MRNQLALLESPFLNERLVDDPPAPGQHDESDWDASRQAEAESPRWDRDRWTPQDESEEEAPCAPTTREDEDAWSDGWLEEEAWSASAEQIAFRDRVLAAHLARSLRRRGAPQRNLTPGERERVAGTNVEMRKDAAAEAGRLLAAANAALAAAQAAGDADALRTIRLTASSGYRASDHQRSLWLEYFPKYYRRTRAARERLAEGPHSDAAIQYMLQPRREGGFGLGGRIAAPGYSNHQNGSAIDLRQIRQAGHEVVNDSGDAAREAWRKSWFHGWLKTHAAARFTFHPIETEEWHWEYRPGRSTSKGKPATTRTRTEPMSSPSAPKELQGGKLWTFQARVLPTQVAVFCPAAALNQRDVDVLFFAHGMLGGCPKPSSLPEGFISGGPFRLGEIVANTNRPLVLVVPHLNWDNPGTRSAFGQSWPRWHAVGKPAHLNALIDEALAELGRVQSASAPRVRSLIVAGHSRAHGVLEPLAHLYRDPEMQRGALAKLSDVWSLDATYAGKVSTWKTWLDANASLRAHVLYRRGSRTGPIGDSFYRERGGRLQVTRVPEGHCAMVPASLRRLLGGAALAPSTEVESLSSDDAEVWQELEAAVDELAMTDTEDLIDDHITEDPESEEDVERYSADGDMEWDQSEELEAAAEAGPWYESGLGEEEALTDEEWQERDQEEEDEGEDEEERDDELASEFDDERYADDVTGELETEDEDAEAPDSRGSGIRPDTAPLQVPLDHPVPFAPIAPPGSYWPVRTTHRSARVVSYMHAGGVAGRPGRVFMAGRIGKTAGRTRARLHAGVDLFANVNDVVVACEAGTIVDFSYFYTAKSKQRTYKILIEHEGSGIVINYGEVRRDSLSKHGLRVGMRVEAGQPIGFVSDTQMLHFETYVKGTQSSHRWWKSDNRAPQELLNPTRYLLALAANGLPTVPGTPDRTPDRVTPNGPAPAPSPRTSPGRLPTLPGLGAGLTPPSDPSAYRKFRLTTYHVVRQADEPTGTVRIPILDDRGQVIAEGSPEFFAKLSLEGTGRLLDDRLVNVSGRKVSVSHDVYAPVLEYHRQAYANGDRKRAERGLKPVSTLYSGVETAHGRVVRALAFHIVDTSKRGVGYGKARGVPYVPFRTLAADIGTPSYKRVEPAWKGKGGLVPAGTHVYIKEYDGLTLPDGTTHDGWFIVNDTGGAIFGSHFDVFTGTEALRKQLGSKLPRFGRVWFSGIERRIPGGYTYGLET